MRPSCADITGHPWWTSVFQTIARWTLENTVRPKSSADHLIWKRDAEDFLSNFVHCVLQRRPPLKWTPASALLVLLHLWSSDVISFALTSRGSECHWLRICQSSFQWPWLLFRWVSWPKREKLGSHSLGSRENRTKQDVGNRLAN